MQFAVKFLHLASITFWIGSIFFFSFFAAPSIFSVLPREAAGDVVAAIFPKYYLVGYVCGGVAIISLLLMIMSGVSPQKMLNWARVGIIALMLGISLYAGSVVRPAAAEIKSQMRALPAESANRAELEARFSALHRSSLILNGIVFLSGIVIICVTAYNYRE
ncbi:MAG: DUF4149 domain-containing protein [Deltaproteobacteria bacterium]